MDDEEFHWTQIETMREVLLEHGFVAAEQAEPEAIIRKINNWWEGGVEAFLEWYDC